MSHAHVAPGVRPDVEPGVPPGGTSPVLASRIRQKRTSRTMMAPSYLAVLTPLLLLLLLFRSSFAPAHAAPSPTWTTGPGYRTRPLTFSDHGSPGFTRLAPAQSGVHFTNHLAESRSLTNHILLNGSGVALGDVDGNGYPDIYLCGLDGPNALYLNRGGGRFQEADSPVLRCEGRDSTGAALADLDGDGDLDLLVNVIGGGTLCFLNDGRAGFTETTPTAGTGSAAGAMSMALADVDGDGDLDLYVAHYRTSTVRDQFGLRLTINRVEGRLVVTAVDGRPTTEPDLVGRFAVDDAGNLLENGEADGLFLNDGAGRFHRVPFNGGSFLDEDGRPLTEPPYDWSLSAMFRDIDRDGRPDLYVCSDLASPDRLWMNVGGGRFQAARRTMLRKTSWFSMGVDFGDLNRDGLDDFFVTDMVSRDHRQRQVQISTHKLLPSRPGIVDDRPQTPRNTLFLNLGDGEFAEIAHFAGVAASEWSWAPVFLDVDLDGYEDILVVTGFERDVQDIDVANALETIRRERGLSNAEALAMRRKFPPLQQANLLFRNRGDLTFEEVGVSWGFHHIGISQGLALADLDGDGDLDLVINDMNAAAAVYLNNSAAPRVAVRLKGLAPNTQGVGARLRLRDGAVPVQEQELIAGGRYLSSDEPLRVFAAGPIPRRMRLEVEWSSGRRSLVTNIVANQIYEIDEAAAAAAAAATPDPLPKSQPLFADITPRLGHTHIENEYDDFARQPLLPRRLSQAGPSVAWHDLDGDGWTDLVLGTGRGGTIGLYQNDRRGGFLPLTHAFTRRLSRDLTGVLVHQAGSSLRILAGFSNFEGAPGEPASIMRLDPAAGTVTDAVPPDLSEPGPLALADLDGDGDLDLFVGGRSLPGRHPESATSRLFRREQEGWVADEANRNSLAGLGLVNGAVFTDLNEDGYPDLAVACDWGPIRLLLNNGKGRLTDATERLGVAGLSGWWQGIAAGDFDGDGRLDLVASNWGLNTRHVLRGDHPWQLHFGDFNGGGEVDLLEAYFDPPSRTFVPWHHFGRVRNALPFVEARFPTYRDFAEASVSDLLAERTATARVVTMNSPASTLFLNRPSGFVSHPLPPAAQFAPAFGISVTDANGDGFEDVFLAQNFFATDSETDRHDGGRGLWLQGKGDGRFEPLSALQSGIRLHGEQRGSAVSDFDRDGRVDLVVGQNGQRTALFRNVTGKPGMRIQLLGSEGNPHAIGAVLRLVFDNGPGAARLVHAGSGYLSQDDPVQVLATPGVPRELIVRWPGGRTTTSVLPPDARSVKIDREGRSTSAD